MVILDIAILDIALAMHICICRREWRSAAVSVCLLLSRERCRGSRIQSLILWIDISSVGLATQAGTSICGCWANVDPISSFGLKEPAITASKMMSRNMSTANIPGPTHKQTLILKWDSLCPRMCQETHCRDQSLTFNTWRVSCILIHENTYTIN